MKHLKKVLITSFSTIQVSWVILFVAATVGAIILTFQVYNGLEKNIYSKGIALILGAFIPIAFSKMINLKNDKLPELKVKGYLEYETANTLKRRQLILSGLKRSFSLQNRKKFVEGAEPVTIYDVDTMVPYMMNKHREHMEYIIDRKIESEIKSIIVGYMQEYNSSKNSHQP